MSLVGTLLDQQSAQLNKGKERNKRSVCRQQLFRSLRAHQYSSDQKKILKDQRAQITATADMFNSCIFSYNFICLYTSLFEDVTKTRHFKNFISSFYKSFTDWQWDENCKNYKQLDQLKK